MKNRRPAVAPVVAYPWATAPWEVKEHAARALGKLNDPRCVPPLIALLESRPLPEDAIEAAVEALGIMGDARAIPVLVAFARKEVQ